MCSDYPAVWCLLNRRRNCPQTTPHGVVVPAWARWGVAGQGTAFPEACALPWAHALQEEMEAPWGWRAGWSSRARYTHLEHETPFSPDPPSGLPHRILMCSGARSPALLPQSPQRWQVASSPGQQEGRLLSHSYREYPACPVQGRTSHPVTRRMKSGWTEIRSQVPWPGV